MPSHLNEPIKDLIKKARIVSFEAWHSTHPAAAVALFQAADDQGRYLSDADIKQLEILATDRARLLPIARQLHEQVNDIVGEARAQLLVAFPTITQPNGGLYPPERADACWRDFWHFLRCITYGIAGAHTEYTSPTGLHYMRLLYQELQVPLDAMLIGLAGLKTVTLKRVEPDRQAELAPYFDHLIMQLSQF